MQKAAKFTAHTLNLPLLKMDVGSLMDKYQGVSEQRMREALKMAESMSPCVLWIDELEKGFIWLATTAAGAPMLGFLGTVTGMVQAFFAMASAGSNANVSVLANGIYEALVTTVAGLFVGIIALFAYNYLVAMVSKVMKQLEAKTMEFMDLLNEPVK